MNEQDVINIVRNEIQKNGQSGAPVGYYHTHDGTNSPKISQSGIIEFTALPNTTTGVIKMNTVLSSTSNFTSFNGNRNVYTIPLVLGGANAPFNGGDAPDGTLLGDITQGQTHLNLCIDNTWYTVPLNGTGGGGGLSGTQTFTSGGTFTVPAGVTEVWVRAIGGGAGGGSTTNNGTSANSGGGGAYSEDVIDLTGVPTVTVTIGAGGAGHSNASDGNGANGGDTKFGTYITAGGGLGTGAGGTATGGSTNISGGNQRYTLSLSSVGASTSFSTRSADSGASFMGHGTSGVLAGPGATTPGNSAGFYGDGGSGATAGSTASGSTEKGGDGSGGILIVIW